MSYIDLLRKSKDKPQVAFQEFALSTSKYSDYLFCFFEGKDNAYYVPRIKAFATDKYLPIKCGGREKVLEVYRLIVNRTEYTIYKKAFFIDKDFNETLPSLSPPIFETPCYSIENLYTSPKVFREILINEFHHSPISDTSFQKCLDFFIQKQIEFHESVILLNAWYACLIKIRTTTGKQTGVSLDETLPKGFIEFSLQKIEAKYDFDTIKQTFLDATPISIGELSCKIDEFNLSLEKSKIFRGKYEMQFLLKIMQMLLKDSNGSQTIIKDKIKFNFGDASGLNIAQSITIFEGYAETPKSLIDYLKVVVA